MPMGSVSLVGGVVGRVVLGQRFVRGAEAEVRQAGEVFFEGGGVLVAEAVLVGVQLVQGVGEVADDVFGAREGTLFQRVVERVEVVGFLVGRGGVAQA